MLMIIGWSTGPNWPAGGAMDIIEGVNSNDFNTLSLQTLVLTDFSQPY